MPQGRCAHPVIDRLGVERVAFPPFRVYLVRCRVCGGALTTRSLDAGRRGRGPSPPPVGPGTDQEVEV